MSEVDEVDGFSGNHVKNEALLISHIPRKTEAELPKYAHPTIACAHSQLTCVTFPNVSMSNSLVPPPP